MAKIIITVKNQLIILETLLYIFKKQMNLGSNFLIFVLKHKDGSRNWSIGGVDHIFKGELIKEIETGDILMLEHCNNRMESNFTSTWVKSNITIESVIKFSKETCCDFYFPKGNNNVFFVIKNYPMMEYKIENNEIISDKLYGNTAKIVNNMCGKMETEKGIVSRINI